MKLAPGEVVWRGVRTSVDALAAGVEQAIADHLSADCSSGKNRYLVTSPNDRLTVEALGGRSVDSRCARRGQRTTHAPAAGRDALGAVHPRARTINTFPPLGGIVHGASAEQEITCVGCGDDLAGSYVASCELFPAPVCQRCYDDCTEQADG